MLVQKLGLKTASRKKGSSGQQVKYYSLDVEELIFATEVLQYRQEQRIQREERKRQRQEENRLYQIMIETQYGITTDSISTPDSNNDNSKLQQGVNMFKSQLPSILDKIKPVMDLLSNIVSLGQSVTIKLVDEVSYENGVALLLIRRLIQPMRFLPISQPEM
ncbi:MAG: hypothetical protein HC764_24415 [Pleurocapsa sp. CRU_1_2]|nr:hypothetical protein [Pleurocapsa sp. CRU_1_2]